MKTHFTEADLLETYYMKPGQSMPIMMHLAACTECAARYERLEKKLREAAACHTEKPESFWARQRTSILHRVAAAPPGRRSMLVPLAAAAVLVLLIGGGLRLYLQEEQAVVAPVPAETVARSEEPVPSDLWESDELREFGSVVQWETWEKEPTKSKGDRS